ncbi:hypothetical protein AADZ90_005255 [Aestuariibius sp. 2305UL40-4]|uniref:hypothetical protein n=1 Tax=Aestuariibius violaceus TaxID=3234132 RepID=UPI00345F026F
MTYEVDGRRYYFPASTDKQIRGNLFGVLPIGAKSSPGIIRPTFKHEHWAREVYVNWRVLDFDMYLETRDDDTIRRGFGRLNEDTEIMRFGRGVLSKLPEYFGIEIDHPSGPLVDFRFYILSKDSTLDDFRLHHHLAEHRDYHALRNGTELEGYLPNRTWNIRTRDDLSDAGFTSFNDAFWLVSQDLHGNYLTSHTAVVSKAPMLHGRYVYGICRSTCWFYSLKFMDDPPNEEPLVVVNLVGDDMAAFYGDRCRESRSVEECDPSVVSFQNIELRFSVVEKVLEALRKQPVVDSD